MHSPLFTRWSCALAWLALLLLLVSSALAATTVSNVRAAQRPSTNLVDVYYDLSGADAGGASVSVALSDDGGANYSLVATTLSGDVGNGVKSGLNRRIVWNAGTDRPDSVETALRFRVTAATTPPAPVGFVLIPAGAFQMGDSFGEGGSYELPVHAVTLSAFYLQTTETTKAQWDEVRTWALSHGYTDLYAGNGKAADHPVEAVSWYDVVKWCNAASERDGLTPVYRTSDGGVYRTGGNPVINYGNQGYRLPTEAEWEKAARGGLSGKRFPWGDTITHDQANYYSYASWTYDISSTRSYHPTYDDGDFPYTSPVGSFPANGYGLYDMTGNVWEWCNDLFGIGYYASSPGSDPLGPSSGYYRLLRGGSNQTFADDCRVAQRFGSYYSPVDHYTNVGFRLARSL